MAPADSSTGMGSDQESASRTVPTATHRLPAPEAVGGEGIRGSGDGTGLRIALVCSRFNGEVTELLLAAALAELDGRGVAAPDRTVAWVPGAFELPLAALSMAGSSRFDAVVCLGAVIRGETSHNEFVAGQCAAGIQRVQLEMKLPVVFGVLTTENLDQALARAGGALGNKGIEAVATAIEMANLLRTLARVHSGAADPAGRAT